MPPTPLQKITEPFILVTVGGGGDGEAIIDWVLRAYESDTQLPYPALLVLGPFMQSERQTEFLARAAAEKRGGHHLRCANGKPDGARGRRRRHGRL
jgi:predicted glycosyltransferase